MKNLRYIFIIIGVTIISIIFFVDLKLITKKYNTPDTNITEYFWNEANEREYAYKSFQDVTYVPTFETEYWNSLKDNSSEKMHYDFLVNLNNSDKKENPVYLYTDDGNYNRKSEAKGFEFARKDHPELELMKIDSRWGGGTFEQDNKNINYEYSSIYYYNKEEYYTKLDEVNSQIKNLVDKVNFVSDPVTKYTLIHNWILENVKYQKMPDDVNTIIVDDDANEYLCQYDTNTTQNLYGAIVEKKAICDGIADAFKYICNQCNLECVIVDGYIGNLSEESYHAWNIVKIDGSWYLVDCTWDLEKGSCNKYLLCKDLYKGDRTPFNMGYEIPGYDILKNDTPIIELKSLSKNSFMSKEGVEVVFNNPNYLVETVKNGISTRISPEFYGKIDIDFTQKFFTNAKIEKVEVFNVSGTLLDVEKDYKNSFYFYNEIGIQSVYSMNVYVLINNKHYMFEVLKGET